MNQRVNTYLYQIVDDLVKRGQMAPQEHRYSIYLEPSEVGDFKFCLIRKTVSPETDLSGINRRTMEIKYFIRSLCGSADRWYGLENSSVIYEYVPLFSKTKRQHKLERVEHEPTHVTLDPSSVAAGTKARVAERSKGDDDEDIFSVRMKSEREEAAEEASKSLVGGDTASFRPLRLDEEEGEEDAE